MAWTDEPQQLVMLRAPPIQILLLLQGSSPSAADFRDHFRRCLTCTRTQGRLFAGLG
jgi:hypothetical protein